jgi:four helix bundle protein
MSRKQCSLGIISRRKGSLNELDTQLEIARRIGYLNAAVFGETELLVDECLAVTYGLRKSLKG